ncbi:MAG: hypothetical protein ACOCWO_02340, partial [Candidatus Muiribacteriaceae bacterium]
KDRIYREGSENMKRAYKNNTFYNDFSGIFWKYSGRLLGLLPKDHISSVIIENLRRKGMDDDIIQQIKDFDEKMNFLAYSGQRSDPDKDHLEKALALLRRVRRIS